MILETRTTVNISYFSQTYKKKPFALRDYEHIETYVENLVRPFFFFFFAIDHNVKIIFGAGILLLLPFIISSTQHIQSSCNHELAREM